MTVWEIPNTAHVLCWLNMLKQVGLVAKRAVVFISIKHKRCGLMNCLKFQDLKMESGATIGVLELNRPQALNALNQELLRELDEFLSDVVAKRLCTVLILKGAGEKAFVAGADIKEMSSLKPQEALQFAQMGQRIFSKLEDLRIPTIAEVQGFALGGGLELALSCDFIVASSKAKFGLPEVSLGLIPGFGGTQRLARRIGVQKAKEFVLTGGMYSAEEALRFGLIAELIEPANLSARVLEKAKLIAQRAPIALEKAKQALHQGFDLSQAEGLALEARLFSQLFETQDTREGMGAFMEKRAPQFQGK